MATLRREAKGGVWGKAMQSLALDGTVKSCEAEKERADERGNFT
jgi:hypothetical protein